MRQVIVNLMLAYAVACAAAQPSDRLTRLEASVAQEPSSLVRRSDLVRAVLEKARHTGDPALLAKARAHAAAMLRQQPDNFEALKAQAWADLLEENYPAALAQAKRLHRRAPDDVELYGYIVEAAMALGDYAEAEKQANWMLRLRTQHRESMRATALLRDDLGDPEGAIYLLNDLFRQTPATETRERAWVLARLAGLTSDAKRAAQMAQQAYHLAPDSIHAARALARFAPDQAKEAVADFAKRSHSLEALLLQAKLDGDYTAFASREPKTPSDMLARIEYALDIAKKPEEALALSQAHHEIYKNVTSLAWHAAVLTANGKPEEARAVAAKVREIGSKDAHVSRLLARVEDTK